MEKRIELEKRGRDPAEILDLILDNCRSTSIVGLTDEFKNLEVLSLINVGLTSLKGFPKLPNLKKLELSDNRISSGLNLLQTSPKLTHLNLSGNKINDWETLQPLKDFKHLKNLDLYNNPATSVENYREKVFALIPSLKYLDGCDIKDEEVEDSDDDEVNGNDGDDSEEDGEEEGDEEEDEEVDDEEIGLGTVYKENLEEESEGDDYDGEGSEEEDDEDGVEEEEDDVGDAEEDGEEDTTPRGKKRKLEGEEEVN